MRRQMNEQAWFTSMLSSHAPAAPPEAQVNRGAALLQLRRYGPAIAAFTEALGLGVDLYKAYFNKRRGARSPGRYPGRL